MIKWNEKNTEKKAKIIKKEEAYMIFQQTKLE